LVRFDNTPLLKRVLLFFAELSIPIFGPALALALVYRFGSEESDLLVVAFFGTRNFNLHASFIGRKEDAVIFYQVLRSARTD